MKSEDHQQDKKEPSIEDLQLEEDRAYAPKSASDKRKQRRVLALTATIASCVIAFLGASLTFNSPFIAQLKEDGPQASISKLFVRDNNAPLSFQNSNVSRSNTLG